MFHTIILAWMMGVGPHSVCVQPLHGDLTHRLPGYLAPQKPADGFDDLLQVLRERVQILLFRDSL